MLYALLHKDKLIGLYNNHKYCNQMLTGLTNNKFAKQSDLKIVNYYDNSITVAEEIDEIQHFTTDNTTDSDSESDSVSTEELDDETRKKIKNTREKKSKIEYNVNLLKKKKETMEESKNVYKVDYELFKKFKKFKESNSNFEIPLLFQAKYKLMVELESKDNLNWETFNQQYKKETMNTSYDKLFDGRTNERELLPISSSDEMSV